MPTYSEVTITFTNDWVDDDTLKIKYDNNGTITSQLWTWVTTRSSGFEVTSGTPTATPGERAAINFEAAFDLDNVSGYITTQTSNAVTIQSETVAEDFLGVTLGSANTGTATISFSNYTAPFDLTSVDFLLTRSPYYINTPFNFDETTKVDIALKIYSGDITAGAPASPTITLQKIRPSIDYAEFNTNISNVIRQYYDIKPRISIPGITGLVDSGTDNLKWVTYTASYTDTTNTIADITGTLLASDGYGRYSEGVNPSAPASQVLTSVTNRTVDRSGIIKIPFISDGTITSIDIDSNGGEINATEAVSSSNVSSEYIQHLFVNVGATTSDSLITVIFYATATPVATLTFEIRDECRYTPYMVLFKNRYGGYEVVTMYKKSTGSINVSRQKFVNNYISSGTYDTEVHQIKDYAIDANEKITINSGYIPEDENDLYRELLESDSVYFLASDETLTPVRVSTSSLDFRTRINDTLVNYTIDFEYAYWTIQSV